MKTTWPMFVLIFSVAAAHAAEREVKLLGVTSGFGTEQAVIGIRDVARNSSHMAVLKSGQEMEGVQMLRIEAAKGAVSVKVNGEERQVSMPADLDGSTNELDPSMPVMNFRGLPLQSAIDLYADCRQRTVLLHPRLGNPTFSLKMNPHTREEAAEAFEKLFSDHEVAAIPDGDHFVMVVPFAFTNSVTPRASTLPQTGPVLPAFSINFRTAPIPLVLETYADFMRKEIVNRDDSNQINCCDTVTLVQVTPLSRDEICYAMETLIEWRNIGMVPDGEGKLKLERVTKRPGGT